MTFRQFQSEQMRRVCSEYGVSAAEYTELYGDQKQEWLEYLAAEAANGKKFSKPVCRSLSDNGANLGIWEKLYRCIPGDVLFANGRTVK